MQKNNTITCAITPGAGYMSASSAPVFQAVGKTGFVQRPSACAAVPASNCLNASIDGCTPCTPCSVCGINSPCDPCSDCVSGNCCTGNGCCCAGISNIGCTGNNNSGCTGSNSGCSCCNTGNSCTGNTNNSGSCNSDNSCTNNSISCTPNNSCPDNSNTSCSCCNTGNSCTGSTNNSGSCNSDNSCTDCNNGCSGSNTCCNTCNTNNSTGCTPNNSCPDNNTGCSCCNTGNSCTGSTNNSGSCNSDNSCTNCNNPTPTCIPLSPAATALSCQQGNTPAMVYEAKHSLSQLHASEEAIRKGTLFPQLYMPMAGECADACGAQLCCGQAEAFAAWELRLYLNTHPKDRQALQLFKQYAAKAYQPNYAAAYAFDEGCDDRWSWTDAPWPWEQACK